MTHSPEPWRIHGQQSESDFGNTEVIDSKGKKVVWPGAVGQLDAERIVACINFCQGLDMDELTRYGDDNFPWMGFVETLRSAMYGCMGRTEMDELMKSYVATGQARLIN